MRRSLSGWLLLAPMLLALAAACAPSDPQAKILDERARWNVRIVSWAQDPAGDLHVGTMVSGPTRSRIGELTVRFDLLDAAGARLARRWHTYDLSQVPRGAPVEFLVHIADPGAVVDGLTVDPVLEPDTEERLRIRELHEESD
jgi:hypothetical protein